MALNTSVGTNPVQLALTLTSSGAGSVAFGRRIRAFTTDQRLIMVSPGAATVYGVNHPGRSNAGRVFRFRGDGVTTVFTLPTAATGVTYPTTADASITAANINQAIFLQLPEERGMEIDATMLLRKGSDFSVTTGQAKINGTTVTVGFAIPAGQWLEVIIPDTAAITQFTGGALTANVPVAIKATDFYSNGVATAVITPIQR